MKTKRSILAAALMLAAALATNASAQSPAIQNFTGGLVFGLLGGNTLGWSFTANQDLNVSALGWATGGALGEPVAIWTGNGSTLLGQVTVTGAFTVGGFAYNNLATPISLTSGQTYLIGGLLNSGSGVTVGATTVTANPFITYIQGQQGTFAGPLNAPIAPSAPNSWFGPNFIATAVPERSSTLVLLGLGVIGLLVCQWKMRCCSQEGEC